MFGVNEGPLEEMKIAHEAFKRINSIEGMYISAYLMVQIA
jgi:hypothetical protein